MEGITLQNSQGTNSKEYKMCSNQVTYQIPSGYDYKPYDVRCGTTNPYGDVALCPTCEHSRDERSAVTDYCLAMGFDM